MGINLLYEHGINNEFRLSKRNSIAKLYMS